MIQAALETGLRQTMTRLVRPLLHPAVPVKLQRSLVSKAYLTSIPPRGTRFEDFEAEDLAITKVCHSENPSGVVLYFHGGGYIIGSPRTHRGISGHLARASGTMVIVPDYRLAPENPYPAALDDAETVYLALLDEGHPPASLSLAGDSAGGGLAIALAMRLRDKGLPLPSSLMVMSPWTDLSNARLYSAEYEPVLQRPWIDKAARLYCGSEPASNPYISPVYGDLSGLPPLLIQVGSQEILLNDARRLADAASQSCVDNRLEIYNSLWHVFQVHAGQLSRATRALETAGQFIRQHLST
ncbi:alpha/beta hydrolase [Marinobacter orientalis]|uniref:Alpha/beta hydrolase n=1 Tax=Marinobacter orientalis TaxID=1928859 RepID=A0A7Y0WT81_9GAMM|nr:alpha/beta hydrolase [Marinobacter orientalis]NMT64556.1 alpha/beta hydrolase [Marinobacter orientalis]TGX50492.1 alpha/beta hydrolase [Marinobacter orientalis]